MLRTEIAELMSEEGRVFDISQKMTYNLALSSEDKEVAEICDAWIKEVAEKGDNDKQIASFIKRTINEELYKAEDALLDLFMERGSIGEFDDTETDKTPQNTLIAHEASKGGTVDRSWIDFSTLKPTWKNRQVETDISYADLRRLGFKAVATVTNFAHEALRNAQFYDIFTMIDSAITGGNQAIVETTATPTLKSMDALALYLNERDNNAVAITLYKYAQAISRMDGYSQYMTESMKSDFNRYGLAKFFSGVNIASINSTQKINKGNLLIPDKKIFGVAGKIGTLDQKGEIHVYEDLDNSNEKLKLKIADFTYGYTITNIENVAKITLA